MAFGRFSLTQIGLAAIIAASAALLGLMLNGTVTVVNHDSAIFCILAQSLLKGHYLLTSEPAPQPYFTFPPFIAVQLAGLMLLFQNFDLLAMQWVFKGYMSLLFLLSLPIFYLYTRRLAPERVALALTALVAVNPLIFKYSSDVLSDTPYWAWSMAAVFAVSQFQKHQAHRRSTDVRFKALWFGLSLLLIIACALTRQIGIALIVAFLALLVLQKQWKLTFVALMSFVFTVGAWQSYEHFYRSAHRSDISSLNQQGVQAVLDKSPVKLEYVKHFLIDKPVNLDENRVQTSPAVLAENVMTRIFAYANVTLDQLLPPIKVKTNFGKISGKKINLSHALPLQLLVLSLFLAGLYASYKRDLFLALYLSLYIAVLLVYPYISPRFWLPVYPLILLCMVLGALRLLEKAQSSQAQDRTNNPRWVTAIGAGLLLIALTAELIPTIHWVNAGYQLKLANVGPSLRKSNRGYYEVLLWLRDHTPQNSLIISRKPPVTYFYSGRKSTAFPFTANADTLFGYIQEKKQRYGKQFDAIYVFEDTAFQESRVFLTPALAQHASELSLVYRNPTNGNRVWRLR